MVECRLLLGNTALSEALEGTLLERGRRKKGEASMATPLVETKERERRETDHLTWYCGFKVSQPV